MLIPKHPFAYLVPNSTLASPSNTGARAFSPPEFYPSWQKGIRQIGPTQDVGSTTALDGLAASAVEIVRN